MEITAFEIWVTVGLLLIVAELLGAEFTALALGLAAIITGFIVAEIAMSVPLQLAVFAALSAVLVPSLVFGFRRLRRARLQNIVVGEGGESGKIATILYKHGKPNIKLGAITYPARAESGAELTEGNRVRVLRMEGITAIVEPDHTP